MSTKPIRILSSEDIRRALSMAEAINAMEEAFSQLSSSEAIVPLRVGIDMPKTNGNALFMPVYLPIIDKVGVKVVSIFKDNPKIGLPMIDALVMVMDAANGQPLAVMNGEVLTAMRTGAASGLATRLLSRENSQVAAIIGAGAQAYTQLEAVCSVRDIKHAFVMDIETERAERFAETMSEKLSLPVEVLKDESALKEADIICTATSSSDPVLNDAGLKPGVHINGIGSYKPHMREIPEDTVIRAKVIVDSRSACLSEAGDLIQPIKNGKITEEHIHAELGEIVNGTKTGRTDEEEITIFKSVGNAVQDLAAANLVLKKAEEINLGTIVQI